MNFCISADVKTVDFLLTKPTDFRFRNVNSFVSFDMSMSCLHRIVVFSIEYMLHKVDGLYILDFSSKYANRMGSANEQVFIDCCHLTKLSYILM